MAIALAVLLILPLSCAKAGGARLKDITHIAGSSSASLFGYGLVIGLSGTGDGQGTAFTTQSLANMMRRMGITVDPAQVKVKNVAAVMVSATLTEAMVRGEHFDVTVSSVGDSKSLRGGTLLLTPLASMDGVVHGYAQGPVSTGGFAVESQGTSVSKNYTLVGRVPGGGMVETPVFKLPTDLTHLELVIQDPDWTTARRVADAITLHFGTSAEADQPSRVKVSIPAEYADPARYAEFVSELEALTIEPDAAAKVVINEKTGTIVAGQFVTIAPVAVAHGDITVQIETEPVISQPAPMSLKGETVTEKVSDVKVTEKDARVILLPATTNIQEVAQSLNAIGATPRDIIAIFQALKQAGALRAELIIL
ncbi:MAG: flagellar basal body P-ring protein FlgI [candidate division Zixibacteria bacterium]|nr:flagellar basal body P-ring protein FlgI [candidate division Zixibacteria bacterium]